MSISGTLATMPMVELLQWCNTNTKTGILKVKSDEILKELFFRDGQLFSSSSNCCKETLGQLLLRLAKITEDDLAEALIAQEGSGEFLGQILLREGLVGEVELNETLKIKTEETIYDSFLWEDGVFAFEEGLPETVPFSVPLNLTAVILEGVTRIDEWGRIRDVFPTPYTKVVIDKTGAGKAAAAEMSEEDAKILDRIGSGKTLAELTLEMHATDFYAASRVFDLYERRLLSVAQGEEKMSLGEGSNGLTRKLHWGLSCYSAGQYSEALSALEAVLRVDPKNKPAQFFLHKIKRRSKQAAAARIPLDAVPMLKVSPKEAVGRALDPEEGFVFSRVDGQWDIRSIIKVCPMREQEVRLIVQQLLDESLIELH